METVGDPSDPDNSQFVNALVRLRGGANDVERFSKDLARVTGRADIDIMNLAEQARTIQRNIAFESRCLLAFGGAAFIAALFLIGQAIARYAAASTNEMQTLQALGMTPAQATVTAAAAPVIVGIIGAGLAAVSAWLVSDRFPYGTADLFEPSPGRSFDWLVLGLLTLTVVLLVSGGAATAARLSLSAQRRNTTGRRSVIATAASRANASVPIVIGTRFALETGRGRTAVPVRPALVGAVMGVLGIVGAFTFSHGVGDAAGNPARFGQTFQLAAYVGFNNNDFGPSARAASALAADDLTVGVADSRTAVATGAGGKASISLWEYQPGPKALDVVVLDGRIPTSADEVMLAPQSLAATHARVGGHVTLAGNHTRTLRVTGVGLVPLGPHNGYADGGWISKRGYESLFTGFKFHAIFVALRPGANPDKAAAALVTSMTKAVPQAKGIALERGDVPTEISLIRQVRTLPILLGAFLGLLAIGAVGHAIATAVRRRSHDLAVLRALGMTQRQCRGVVVTQASVLALVGLVFGVPLGIALGRTVWRVVADYTPLQYVTPVAFWALLLVSPGAIVAANVLAAWPGRRAARMRISHILRTE
jgi:ribosomal protein S19